MQINISTRHGHLSAETRDKMSAKLGKLERFHERVTAVNVTVDLEHPDSPRVELRVSVEHSADFIAIDASESLLGSLDASIRKAEQQLRRHKEKIKDRRHGGAKSPRIEVETEESDEPDEA